MIEKTKRILQWIPIQKNQNSKNYVGLHLVAEFWYCENQNIIENEKKLKKILIEAVKSSGAVPLKSVIHKFFPQGITGMVLLSESHLSLHSWPEINYIAIDVFTCGLKTFPYKALDYLKEVLKPQKVEIKEIKRGVI